MEMLDVVFIGNYTKDVILSPAGTRHVDGGAVNYAAHAAARLGLRVGVVMRLAQEDRRVVERLEQDGVACRVTYTPASTCVRLEYPGSDPDVRTLYVTSTAGSITPQEALSLPTKVAVIGTSFRGEVGLEVIQALRKSVPRLGCDVQGFVRVLRDQTLVYEPWEEMRPVLRLVDILKADMTEAEFLTGENETHRAATCLAELGPAEIVLTHKDGLLVYAGGQFFEYGFYPANLNGRSGRGDTCLGTYAAMRTKTPPQEAGMWAAAVTSLKMEKLGTFDRSLEEVKAFIQDHYNLHSYLIP
jgi:sugar/nucleoside kinase (ribokinase family)